MSQLLHFNLWHRDRTIGQKSKLAKRIASLGLVVLCTTGCTQSAQVPIELSLNVKSASRPGMYQVSGKTNLPEQSRISVVGIRYLKSLNAANTTAEPSYSILARQSVEVSQSRWQTTLNVLQLGANGQSLEAWQTRQRTRLAMIPASNTIVFVAIFEPERQTPSVQQEIKAKRLNLNKDSIQLTDAGQPYLQVQQSISAAPPDKKTTSAATLDQNDGWGDRAVLKPQPSKTQTKMPLQKEQQTSAPLSNSQLFR
jgi:hypothetical protein